MHDSAPSTFLPGLVPPPPTSAILTCISRLADFCAPPSAHVDLRPSMYTYSAAQVEGEGEADAFELGFARSWLEKVLAFGSRVLMRGTDGADEWEEAVGKAASLLAAMSGPSAQGSVTKTYLLPAPPLPSCTPTSALSYPTPPPTRPSSTTPTPRRRPSVSPPSAADSLSLTIRDGTLTEASTGHRTWGAATILAHLVAANPARFFPSSESPAQPPLRVLELGSGTGLVGLAAAAVLGRTGASAEVTLSDGGDEPDAVLANLRENVAENSSAFLPDVAVRVERLDWRDYVPSASSISTSGAPPDDPRRLDVLLGADLAYEAGQAALLHAAAAGLLRFPSAEHPHAAEPTFWLALPLRPTHARELAEVEALFPPSTSAAPAARERALSRVDSASGRSFRLVTREREELRGPSGFGGRAVRGRVEAMGEMRYWVMRIVWEEVRVE